jgi:hypothetical protein
VLWNWLQPYLVANTDGSRGTEYNGLLVGVDGMFDFVIFSFYLLGVMRIVFWKEADWMALE